MTDEVGKKIVRLREELTNLLTSSEVDVEALDKEIKAYCSLLPDYIAELRAGSLQRGAESSLEKELVFAQQITSSVDRLKSERKDALLALVKGRKAKSAY